MMECSRIPVCNNQDTECANSIKFRKMKIVNILALGEINEN